MEPTQIVFVVDDDAAMRESMALMLELAGFRVKSFDSARAFLAACFDRFGLPADRLRETLGFRVGPDLGGAAAVGEGIVRRNRVGVSVHVDAGDRA